MINRLHRATVTTCGLAVLAVTVLTGCGFSGSVDDAAGPSSPVATSSADPTTSAAPPSAPAVTPGADATVAPVPGQPENTSPDRCHTGDLSGSLTNPDAGAGQRTVTLVLTNTSGRTCDIQGFGGVGLLDPAGQPLPTQQKRLASPAPALVALSPGASASSLLRWTVVPGDDDAQTGDCQTNPGQLAIIPPDETDPLTVAWTLGPVCQDGTLQQNAYSAG